MNALPNRLPPRTGFRGLDGLPDRDDPELVTLMGVVSRLPKGGMEEIVCSLTRIALAFDRTADPEFLTTLAEDHLVTLRIRRDPETEKALNAPHRPADPADTLDVEEMLARHGL
jgi:hypothetical protein